MSEILCINNFENEEKKMEDKNVGLKKLYLNKKHIKEEETNPSIAFMEIKFRKQSIN